MKKLLVFVIILLAAAATVSAFDFGLTIDNSTGFTKDEEEAEFTQRDKASLWFDGNVTKNLTFATQGSYTFTIDEPVFFDLELLRVGGNFANTGENPFSFSFKAGRFKLSDFTNKVLSHTADGGYIELASPTLSISFSTGFTGLVQKPASSILMSLSDVEDRELDGYYFGSHRFIQGMNIKFPEILFNQTLNLSMLYQRDLRAEERLHSGGGYVHTFYHGAGLSGPIVPPLYYNAFVYINSGTVAGDSILAEMAGVTLNLYLQELLGSKVSLDFVYASGDADYDSFYEGNTEGAATAFVPISISTPALVFAPQLSNIIYGTFSFLIKPLYNLDSEAAKKFSIELKVSPFLRPTPGPISVSGVDDDSEELYAGTEVDTIISARPLSDLGLGLSFGMFFPGEIMESEEVQLLGRFDLSLSF